MGRRGKTADQPIVHLIRQYIPEHGREACLSSVIRAWLRINSGSPHVTRRCDNVQRAASVSPAGDLEDQIIMATSGTLPLNFTDLAFESLLDKDNKRSIGAVYTPHYVIDYIVKRCVTSRKDPSIPKLIDPACGSGGFLVRAIPILSAHYNVQMEKVVNELVHGVDVSEEAIEYSKLSIEIFCATESFRPPDSFDFLINGDTLTGSANTLLDAAGIDGEGFDVVVTNPPYVKLQNLDYNYRQLLCDKYPEFTTGSFSTAMLFLIAGHRLLSRSGLLGYITQNNIYTSLAGKSIRRFLQDRRSLHTIIDFGHTKVFRGASAYTCLIFLERKPRDELYFRRCSNPESQLPLLRSKDFCDIAIDDLDSNKWRLAPPHHLRNLRKLESNGTPLGILAEIKVGFATLKDSVFLIDDHHSQNSIETDVTTPAIKIANFKDEKELKKNKLRVIQPYQKVGSRWTALTDDEFRRSYPNAYSYLKSNKAELLKRDKGKKQLGNFYEWGRTQCMEALGPKLLTKTFNRGPNFLLDETDSLFCNGYSVKPKYSGQLFSAPIDIHVLQRILNSWVIDYYARLTSFQIEGGYQCFQKNFIERFCIPDLAPTQSETILRLEDRELEEYISQLFGLHLGDIMEVVAAD